MISQKLPETTLKVVILFIKVTQMVPMFAKVSKSVADMFEITRQKQMLGLNYKVVYSTLRR